MLITRQRASLVSGVKSKLEVGGCGSLQGGGHPPKPLTMHMIHPRVSLLRASRATSMVGRPSPTALSCRMPV